MGPASYNDKSATTVRVKNIRRTAEGKTSFDWQFQEWSYLDQKHGQETVGFVIAETGKWKLADGSYVVAGKTWATNSFNAVTFPTNAYTAAPVVFSSVTTIETNVPYVTRTRFVTNKGFQVAVQAEERKAVKIREEVSYLAWGITSKKGGQWYAFKTKKEVNHVGKTYKYYGQNDKIPIILANT